MDDSILITTGTTLKGNVVLGLEESCFVETEAEDGTETLSVVLCVSQVKALIAMLEYQLEALKEQAERN